MQKYFCDICGDETPPRPEYEESFVRGIKHPAFYFLQGTVLIGFQTWDFSASRLNGDKEPVGKPIDLCRTCIAKFLQTATPVTRKGLPLKDMIPEYAPIRDIWDAEMSFEALAGKVKTEDLPLASPNSGTSFVTFSQTGEQIPVIAKIQQMRQMSEQAFNDLKKGMR